MRKILRGHVFNKIFLFILCLGTSFLFEVHAQVSGTFTINPGAAVSATNFHTFSAAVAALAGGVNGPVTINVAPGSGPYNEQVILNNIAGTSAANTITFNCNGVTLGFHSSSSNSRAVVKLNNTDYVTFDNLTVEPDAAGPYGYGFHLLNDADHNTISNCTITNIIDFSTVINHEGIVINGNDEGSTDPGYSNCDSNLIENNIITGGVTGITLSSIPAGSDPARFMSGNRIIKNTISNTLISGLKMFYNSGTEVNGNILTGGPDAVYDLTGIELQMYNESISITNNRIHGFHSIPSTRQIGILISSETVAGKENLIANNLIYDFQNEGIQYGIASRVATTTYSGNYLNIYHNTISLDDKNLFGMETYALYLENVTDVNVINNIFTITREASDYNAGISFGQNPQRVTIKRNTYYIPDGPAYINAIGVLDGVGYEALSEWQEATGFDSYSSDIDPAYADLAAFDLRPTAQIIDNLGTFINVNTDITGAARSSSNPDVGCFEFISAPCSPSITAGIPIVAPDSIMCIGPSISMGLSGHTAGGGQTYTWQTAASATGPFTDVTSPLGYPYFETTPNTTLYYRVALTCGATVGYSTPIRVLVNSAVNSGTYTINSALPTGGINFNSFRDASLALQCGLNGSVVFNVASGSGPYNEQLIIPAIATSPTKTVTFNCNGVTIGYKPTAAQESAVVKLNGADHITIDSLNVDLQGTSSFGYGIQLVNDADHNTIKRCTVNLSRAITRNNYAGIVVNASNNTSPDLDNTLESYNDSNLIAGNTIIGGYYGITCTSRSSDSAVSYTVGNIISKNTIKDAYRYGIYVTGTSKLMIDSNDISQPERTNLTTFTGINAMQVNFDLTISRNRIHNLAEAVKDAMVQLEGISMDRCTATVYNPNIIKNNLIYGFRGNDYQYGLYLIGSDNVKCYHNTVSLDDTASKSTLQTRGFGLFLVKPGIEFKNNNIVISRGGNGIKYCMFLNINDNTTVSDYNNLYIRTTKGTSYIGSMGGVRYATLTNWLAARKDSNSVSMDPVPHDPATGDYTPTKIAFENRGINVGIAKDIVDSERDLARPDIGAHEFTICRPLTTPVLTVDSAGVNAVKFSWSPVQNTTGYRVSRDGINWVMPTSGAMGLSHTIAGLKPADTIGLMVKALGSRIDCQENVSQREVARTLTDGIYIPNTFTPNGNTQNETFRVYTNLMRSIRWMVFNQWGEKVFETADLQGEWDGLYKGKPQPVGVYIYVMSGTLADGTKITRKGTFNLIR